MGRNSTIEWTDHTFNPWWGCVKWSPACNNCYAEAFARRLGKSLWGPQSPRRVFGELHWAEPLKWNAEAKASGKRRRVFCASMADVFEDREDLLPWREKLWDLIRKTPNLNWLLLTKRPGNIAKMVPWLTDWPDNVWVGTTVENQRYADERLPYLLRLPAAVRFLSCEPLLGPLDLSGWSDSRNQNPINWVIVGGESGRRARPMHPEWALSLRDFCLARNIPFHFKQWGEHGIFDPKRHTSMKINYVAGKTIAKMVRVGKGVAGRVLDRRTYDELPTHI